MDIGLAFLGACFIAISLFGAVYGVREFRNGRQSEGWPKVAGKVVESSVQHDDDGAPIPSIRYEYYVNEIPFHCERILYEMRKLDLETAVGLISVCLTSRTFHFLGFSEAKPGTGQYL